LKTWILFLVLFSTACTQQNELTFSVVDTDFSKGRLGFEQQIVLADLVKFHGHQCDGLVVGAQAMQLALAALYPDQNIDRTNLRIVSKPSPCLADVAIYCTGGRYQFNTFYVDTAFGGLYIIQRIDNGQTIEVGLNLGVKPTAIDSLGALANRGLLSPCGIDSLQKMEDAFMRKMLAENPAENYFVKPLANFTWLPNSKNNYLKTDVVNKDLRRCE
jgi:acetolactate decarboxylase